MPRACKSEGSRVFTAGRREVPFSEELASLQSLDPWNTKGGKRELCCMALVLVLAINVLFQDLDLNLAAPGEILVYLLAANVACRETKLEGCADSIKTNTCYRHGPSISSLTTQLRLRYALNIDSERGELPSNIAEWRLWCSCW